MHGNKAGTEGRIHRKQQTVGPFLIGFKIESYNYKVVFYILSHIG